MDQQFLENLHSLYEAKDLEALDALATPTFRTLQTSQKFRSALMLSCNNIKHLCKITSLEADAIILNLEDGVSVEEKPYALVLCAIFLSRHQKCDKKLIVRVNPLDEGGYDEIAYLNQFMPDAIRVPKIRDKREVQSVLHLLKEGIELHLSIETAESWNKLASLKVDKRVKAFYLGVLDLFADMKFPHSMIEKNNPTMRYILSHFLVTSKAMGVKPISFVYQDFKNLEAFSEWIALEKEMGYDAKGCISPDQVKLVNAMFVDKEEELARAKTIVKLFEMHRDEGITGFVDEEYGFIDEPIYKGALALLAE